MTTKYALSPAELAEAVLQYIENNHISDQIDRKHTTFQYSVIGCIVTVEPPPETGSEATP